MKKKIALLLAAVLAATAMTACGKGAADSAAPAEETVTEEAAVEEAAAEEGGVTYNFIDETLGVESYAIGFRLGDTELAETVSGAVQALVLDGTYDEIGKKYPEIYDYLCLKAEDIDESTIPERRSGDPGFTFKHGFDLDYPPYSFINDAGETGGFDVEMAQAVCEYMGWGYEAVPFNWDAKDAELNAQSCDCIWSGFTKEGREDQYTWGITYSNNTQGILVASDSGIKTLADLEGKVVGVQTATSAYDMLQDSKADLAATFGDLKVYETYTVAYNDLKAGAIDAIAIDMTAGSFLIAGDQ